MTSPAPAARPATATPRTGTSASPSCSTARCAGPCPSKTTATRQPSRVHAARVARSPARCPPGTPRPRVAADGQRRRRSELGVGGERGDRPPRACPATPASARTSLDRAQRRGAEVDRRGAAAGRRGPGRAAGTPPTSGPGRRPGSGSAPGRRPARACRPAARAAPAAARRPAPGPAPPCPRPGAVGELVQHLGQLRVLGREPLGPLPHRRGEQQLPARRRPQPVLGGPERALVGDGEEADLLDLVAPELDPHRVLLGGREDVEDAAADGELAALLDQVDPGVADVDQPLDQVVELGRVAGPRGHRLQVAEARHLRLQHRRGPGRPPPGPGRCAGSSALGWASRRSTASRRPTVSARGDSRSCGSVSQDGKPTTSSGGQQAAQRVGQVVGLPAGGGDGQHRPAGAAAAAVGGERGGDERAQRRRRGEVERGHPGRGDAPGRGRDRAGRRRAVRTASWRELASRAAQKPPVEGDPGGDGCQPTPPRRVVQPGLRQLPHVLGRPPPRPVGGHEVKSRVAPAGALQLEQVLDLEAGRRAAAGTTRRTAGANSTLSSSAHSSRCRPK